MIDIKEIQSQDLKKIAQELNEQKLVIESLKSELKRLTVRTG